MSPGKFSSSNSLITNATDDLDIGLVVSNAGGTGNPGEFFEAHDRQLLEETLRTQHHVAFRHRPLLRREARRAEAGAA